MTQGYCIFKIMKVEIAQTVATQPRQLHYSNSLAKKNKMKCTSRVYTLLQKKRRGNKYSLANPFLLVYNHYSHLWRCVVEHRTCHSEIQTNSPPPFFFEDGYENGCCGGERIM